MNFYSIYNPHQLVVKLLFIALVLSGLTRQLNAQEGFSGAIVFGLNAAQIDGDGLYGYDKLGLNTGVRLGYKLGEKSGLLMELLYSERGSTPDVAFGGDAATINLKYIEIPVLFEYNDWYMEEDDYFKVGIEGGLVYGNLFSVTSSNDFVINDEENYKNSDFSYTLGARYNFSKRLSGLFRYSRSLVRIYELEGALVDGFVNHWLTLRLQYHL